MGKVKLFLIGIAGGSGSGKTKLASEIKRYFDRDAVILNIDNYQLFGQRLPLFRGMKNWDHPRSIDWNTLWRDLRSLKQGKIITIKTRNQKNLLKRAKVRILKPSKILIAEGYFLFYNQMIRRALDCLIYLEASDNSRLKRRVKSRENRPDYLQNVLLLMHYKYIEPTKKFAHLILNTEKLSPKELCKKVVNHLKKSHALV